MVNLFSQKPKQNKSLPENPEDKTITSEVYLKGALLTIRMCQHLSTESRV
jgi:hypothetical protein